MRRRHLDEAALAGNLRICQIWQLPDPLKKSAVVYAALLAPPSDWFERGAAEFPFPSQLDAAHASFLRLLDRFYLPTLPSPEVSRALFEIIAQVYDQFTSRDLNREIARVLLDAVVHNGMQLNSPVRILDFGCGTGIAFEALDELAPPLKHVIELIGTDASPRMLDLARRHGEQVIGFEEWRRLPAGSFDGAIASFVLHYGISQPDVAKLAVQLRRGALFAANYFKASEPSIKMLVKQLCIAASPDSTFGQE